MKFALLVSDFITWFERPFHHQDHITFMYIFFLHFYGTFSFYVYISYPSGITLSSGFIKWLAVTKSFTKEIHHVSTDLKFHLYLRLNAYI